MPNKTIYAVAWSPGDGRWRLVRNAIGSTTGFTAGSREEYSCGTKTIVGVGGDATYSLFVTPRSATPDEVLAACAVGSSVPLNAFFTISIRSATGQPTVVSTGEVTARLDDRLKDCRLKATDTHLSRPTGPARCTRSTPQESQGR